ncbi:hypothetical protein KR074_002875 [Drosophila pseudoananassae]|nr:hypothetical protein KR074_002875 [Drosophila pseudoananassae]
MDKQRVPDNGVIRLPWQQHRHGTPFRQPLPKMTPPECIGAFSITDGEFQNDARNVSYLCDPLPEIPIDLNQGIENVIRKGPRTLTDVEYLVKYVESHRKELLEVKGDTVQLEADFVVLRGVLRHIMCLQYDRAQDSRIKVTRANGTIYINKEDTEEKLAQEASLTKRQLDMCSWGFKFEQCLTSDKPSGNPVIDVPVNEGVELNCVFRRNINGLRLLYGAEMDCIVSSQPVNFQDPLSYKRLEFVELKTTFCDMKPNQQRNFTFFKSANWWSQSFLVGIKTIYAGLRDENGVVQEIRQYDTRDMPKDKPWSPAAMVIFLEKFLRQLKSLMEAIDDPFAVVQVDFKSQERCAYYKVLRGKEHQILPDWYRDLLKGQSG